MTLPADQHPVINRQMTKSWFNRLVDERKAELIGVVGEWTFYEDPIYGDEAELIATNGKEWGESHFRELPDLEEIS